MVAEFKRRRARLVGGLNELPGVSCRMPGGAFYAFPNITGTGMTSQAMADALLDEAGVAVLSGTSFGAFGEGYIRISSANSFANSKRRSSACTSSWRPAFALSAARCEQGLNPVHLTMCPRR